MDFSIAHTDSIGRSTAFGTASTLTTLTTPLTSMAGPPHSDVLQAKLNFGANFKPANAEDQLDQPMSHPKNQTFGNFKKYRGTVFWSNEKS